MYLPQQFNHPQHAAAIMREHPFASLVSTDGDGFPFVTHLPLKLMEESPFLAVLARSAKESILNTPVALRPLPRSSDAVKVKPASFMPNVLAVVEDALLYCMLM